jgi:hypothetical protein
MTVAWSPDLLLVLGSVGISLAVLAVATAIQFGLTLAARKNGSSGSAVLKWDDALFWNDWTTNILLAFGILLLQGERVLDADRLLVLLACALLGLLFLPIYVRFLGTDQVTGAVLPEGIIISNVASFLIILVALLAGAELF